MTSYFLLILTNIVPDIEVRDEIGWVYLYTLITVAALNFLIIIKQVISMLIQFYQWSVKKFNKKQEYEKKLRKEWELSDDSCSDPNEL